MLEEWVVEERAQHDATDAAGRGDLLGGPNGGISKSGRRQKKKQEEEGEEDGEEQDRQVVLTVKLPHCRGNKQRGARALLPPNTHTQHTLMKKTLIEKREKEKDRHTEAQNGERREMGTDPIDELWSSFGRFVGHTVASCL